MRKAGTPNSIMARTEAATRSTVRVRISAARALAAGTTGGPRCASRDERRRDRRRRGQLVPFQFLLVSPLLAPVWIAG